MAGVRYFAGVSESTAERRLPGHPTPPAALIHAFLEGDREALCGAVVWAEVGNFEHAVGKCRPCLERVLAPA